jgi:hypothetical protein
LFVGHQLYPNFPHLLCINTYERISAFIMGNSAAKELQEKTELVNGTIDESTGIVPSLVTKEALVANGNGKTWTTEAGESLFYLNNKGLMKSHTLVETSAGVVATMITKKKAMTSATTYICKTEPTYDGQDALTAEELKKSGIEEGTTLYPYGVIIAKMKLTSATATYGIVTGKEGDELVTKEVYTAKKASAMNFYASFMEGDDTVAMATTKGMSMKPTVQASSGVDILAVVCMGNCIVGDGSAAGAMAGAGVV